MGIEEAVVALRAGQPVVLPTDTVYGLCADAYHEGPVRRMIRLKGRPEEKPVALMAPDLDVMLDALPELRGRKAVLVRALLPGPFTLIVPNTSQRFRWLTGPTPEAIGIRVPELPEETHAILERVGAVAATSANLHGGRDPARLGDVSEEIWRNVGALVDGGELPGTPSTVIDLTGSQPRVQREGAVSSREALATIARVAAE